MVASEDVRRVTFEKAMRGYRCEDVDDYLKQVADSMDSLATENYDLQKKLQVLADRIAEYRAEEDTLHTTLINAQRLGENVIKEAKQKAAEIIRTANMQAEDREQRSRDEVELSKQQLTTVKKEVSDFKRTVMELYRQHVEMLAGIPEEEDAAPEPAVPMQEEPALEMLPAEEPAAPLQDGGPELADAYYGDEPEEEPAGPDGERIDTLEFALAPREEAEVPEQPAARAGGRTAFAPGAGLYDAPVSEPPARGRSGNMRTKRAKPAPAEETEALPSAFDSFSGIDFDS